MSLFLSYRHTDSQEVVGRMYDRLKLRLPVEKIFRDLHSIPPGKVFHEVIREALGKSKVALIVIGPRWTAVTDSAGNPRLRDPTDLLRIEVELALSSGILVVPVLVSGASIPQDVELPTTLRSLASLQAIQVRPDPDFHRDMDRLIGKLSHLVDLGPLLPARGQAEARSSSPWPDCGTATMCRREFLRAGILVLTVVATERVLREYDRRCATSAKQMRQEEKVRDLFGQLFGAPAKTRFSHEGTHPDNLAAARVLRPVLGLYDSKPIPAPAGGQIKILPEGDVVLIGGPNSTPLTMIAWEFDGPNMRELDRDRDPIIPLRFYGISNANHPWLPGDPVGWHLETVGPVSTVNWPYVDTKSGEPLIPNLGSKIEVKGEKVSLPSENYLLVTKLPNFLSSKRQGHPSSWPQLLVFEGNNGVGTRAAELLLQPVGLEALDHVKSRLQGATAFQTLFRVYDLELTTQGFHRFRKIEPLDWAIEPLKLDEQTYEKAHKKAISRLYAEKFPKQI